MTDESAPAGAPAPADFIRDAVASDLAAKRHAAIVTRFPPEPNGYLHIGHAKAICINAGIARENQGRFNLRMDDTNPAKEDAAYVNAIVADVKWLIDGWADHCLSFQPKGAIPAARTVDGKPDFYLGPVAQSEIAAEPFHASNYFEALHEFALTLIKKGKAYVCDLSPKETDEYRGAPDKPGRDSPFRNRSVAENLDLFQRMKAGEFPDGARSLRSRIDMASPNMWLRDPLLYRIRHTAHHQTGDKWCIYPLYDYAHCLSDYIEGVTHSLCSLEFTSHRPLYDWVLEQLDLPRPRPHQYEFAKLITTYMITSKRNLLRLVNEGIVSGWDDPRLPTLAGIRRRGIPASAVRNFAIGAGVTKYDSVTEIAVFEHHIREELNLSSVRRLAVLRPVKVILTNLAPGEVVECEATNDPQAKAPTTRKVTLTREVFIESDDFAEVPPPKYFRLKPGGEVRLKYACIIMCDEVVKDAAGRITELRCTADLTTRTGGPNADKKVKGTIHWVNASLGVPLEVRLYDRLFTVPEPWTSDDLRTFVNLQSLERVTAIVEPSLAGARPGERFQFERLGYFTPDANDSAPGKPVFNRTISLKDTWAKPPGAK